MGTEKVIYARATGLLWMISFTACSSSSPKEAPSTSNATLGNISARKSVRAYLDKEVEKEKIDLVLRASMAVLSGKDLRPWEFVLVTDRVVSDSMASALPYTKMLTQARYVIVVCGDVARSSYWYLDCPVAIRNVLLATEAQGLGAVWIAAYPCEDRVRAAYRYTEFPGNIMPLYATPFGYPATLQEPKQRYDEKEVHYEKY